MDQICVLRTGRFEYLDGTPLGLRHVRGGVSNLRITAAPFDALDRALAHARQPDAMAYVLKGDVIYVGHGSSDRRVGDRLTPEELAGIEQVFLIHSDDREFGKHAARIVECRLWKLANERGVPLANRSPPNGVSPEELNSAYSHELIREIRLLLVSVGCTIFEECYPVPTTSPSLGPLKIKFISGDELASYAGSEMVLKRAGIYGSGIDAGKEFVILAGSHFRLADKRGLDRTNRRRRDFVRESGRLDPLDGDSSLARMRDPLVCESRAIAAKLLTGTHANGRAWQSADADEQLQFGFGKDY